jgi:hypothetical protein
MPDETEPGAAYLAALKQGTPSPPSHAAPVERSTGKTEADSAVSAHRDKRKSPRYSCNGSARLQSAGSSSSSWATFTDISMHGCYIESSAPYSVGTILQLKLEAANFRVESEGEVRVAYPGLGMGISFTKMSESDRGQLRDLLSSISPRSKLLATGTGRQTPPIQPVPTANGDVPAIADSNAVLQAMVKFFKDRHMMGREEFIRILRNSR